MRKYTIRCPCSLLRKLRNSLENIFHKKYVIKDSEIEFGIIDTRKGGDKSHGE